MLIHQALNAQKLQLLTALDRIAARNVVREAAPVGAAIGKVHLHIDSDRINEVNLKRKRTQPVGSRECVEGCGRIVSANKGRCFACTQALGAVI